MYYVILQYDITYLFEALEEVLGVHAADDLLDGDYSIA